MVKKVLTFETQSSSTELLPTRLDGKEGISMPFSYDVTLISRHRDTADTFNNPATSLVGTMARIGFLLGPNQNTDFTHRTGIISRFEMAGTFKPGGFPIGEESVLTVFKATVVPAVFMLGRQTAFRVFEDQDVVTIINALLADMQSRFANFLFDTSRLKSSDFQKMEYCVQYGESTFGFLTRLMERFGIWYIFDNVEQQTPSSGSADDPVIGGNEVMMANNTTMVLGRLPFQSPTPCDINTHTINDSDPAFSNDVKGDNPKQATVSNFRRVSNPVTQNSWYGNFNILNPAQPVLKSEKFGDSSNVLIANASVADFFQSEEFPGQFENDPGAAEGSSASGQGDRNIQDYADTRMQQQRVLSSKITGATINPTLKAGRTIKITPDRDSHGEPGDYLITMVSIAAFENSYQTTSTQDFWNFMLRDLILSPFQSGKTARDTLLSGAAVGGLNNYLQNQQANMFYNAYYPHGGHAPDAGDALAFISGGITQVGITSVIPLLLADIDKLTTQNDGAYTNTFEALQQPSTGGYMAPTPTGGPRPIAYGPHLAVVIGSSGLDNKDEVYADAIGRVRVRFPWDPGPPAGVGKLPTPWSSLTPPDKPYHSGQNTCWVRVSEGWAGQQYGSQFLPRVGQEVLVGFIDGNPERPIIVGRVYNASSGVTNLPYPAKSAAQKLLSTLSDLKGTASNLLLRTGIKTRSVPQPKSGRGFHMLRFDDTGGSEQFLMRSQGRLDVTALGSKFETLGGNLNLSVGGIDTQHQVAGGNYIAKVCANYTLHVGDPAGPFNGGTKNETIEKNYNLDVKKDMLVSSGKDINVSAAEVASVNADTIVLEASSKITLKVGGNFIVITPAGVSIKGILIGKNSGGSPDSAPIVVAPTPASPAIADDGTK